MEYAQCIYRAKIRLLAAITSNFYERSDWHDSCRQVTYYQAARPIGASFALPFLRQSSVERQAHVVRTPINSHTDTQARSLPNSRHFDATQGELSPRRLIGAAQRLLDIVFSLFLLILGLPVFFLLAILIRLDSPGPTLFAQVRVGKGGKEFRLYKFRSMAPDAEALRVELEHENEQDGPLFKIREDPRVTRVGRLLRKYSFDELPQLINVLKGDMSLIGPRPALPVEVDQYTPYHRQRLIVTPGLTGLWQVSGRADLPFERAVELDLYYIEHQSVWLNLWILIKTVPAVISARGAY
jgi:exopolysaccharide biosynthesis polyprenyl glycosylphosphotransferase